MESKKYIDANALLNEAKRLSGPQTGDGWDNWGVYALIERQPALSVEEVVRCKECEFSYTYKSSLLGSSEFRYCRRLRDRWNKDEDLMVEDDNFCSWAVRMEEK